MAAFNGYELPRVLTPAHHDVLGLKRSRIRTNQRWGNWRQLPSGLVLTRPESPTRTDWLHVGLWIAGPGSAVTGWDAVRRYGLGNSQPPTGEVIVLAATGRNRAVGPVRIRPTPRPYTAHRIEFDLDVVNPARAVSDTALQYRSLVTVRALVTSAIQRGVCTPGELVAELDRYPRKHGAALRRALSDFVDGARSVAEVDAVARLRRAQVPPFELNVEIVNAAGHVVFIVDVFWRELRAVLEVDSREFHFLEADWARTLRRHNLLTAGGLALTHFPPSAIRTPGWSAQVERWLRARAAELGLPYRVDARPLSGPRPAWQLPG